MNMHNQTPKKFSWNLKSLPLWLHLLLAAVPCSVKAMESRPPQTQTQSSFDRGFTVFQWVDDLEKAILPFQNKQTILFLDVDGTLITMKHNIDPQMTQWKKDFENQPASDVSGQLAMDLAGAMDQFKKNHPQPLLLNQFKMHLLAIIRNTRTERMLDPKWPGFMQRWAETSHVYGLTAMDTGEFPLNKVPLSQDFWNRILTTWQRNAQAYGLKPIPNLDQIYVGDSQQWRLRYLEQAGTPFPQSEVQFSPQPGTAQTAADQASIQVQRNQGGPGYRQNIFFTGYAKKKSNTLDVYWDEISRRHPDLTTVILVDDKKDNLDDLKHYFTHKHPHITFHGCLFTSPKMPPMDPDGNARLELLANTGLWIEGTLPQKTQGVVPVIEQIETFLHPGSQEEAKRSISGGSSPGRSTPGRSTPGKRGGHCVAPQTLQTAINLPPQDEETGHPGRHHSCDQQ